jgi:hypothetical protein
LDLLLVHGDEGPQLSGNVLLKGEQLDNVGRTGEELAGPHAMAKRQGRQRHSCCQWDPKAPHFKEEKDKEHGQGRSAGKAVAPKGQMEPDRKPETKRYRLYQGGRAT